MSVEDLISSDYKKEEVIQLKEISKEIFQEGGFILHKRHTNCGVKSHENHHKIIKHQFTNHMSTKSQKRQISNLIQSQHTPKF